MVLDFCNIHREAPLLKSLFNKVAALKACNFIKKRLRYSCFSVNTAKFLKSFFIEHPWRLLQFIASSMILMTILLNQVLHRLTMLLTRKKYIFLMINRTWTQCMKFLYLQFTSSLTIVKVTFAMVNKLNINFLASKAF